MSVASLANVQLSVLQLPEVAREEIPVLAQSEIMAGQTPAIIQQYDQEAAETIQTLQPADWRGVPSALDGSTTRQPPSYRDPGHFRGRLQTKTAALAATDPRGVGQLVDVRA